MPDFSSAQAQLIKSIQARKDALAVEAQATAKLKATQAAQTSLSRSASTTNTTAANERTRLAAQNSIATAELNAARDKSQSAAAEVLAASAAFAEFSDPRRNLGRLSDDAPFALFPVRLETRFMTVGSGPIAKQQLWVRIFPDDCSIDTFEADLSTTELMNAKLYWQAIWRAGGVEADERAAWSSLVSAHGSGRAGYIVDTYQPLNLSDKPVKANASDEILAIPTQTPLISNQATAISVYWKAIWLAGGDLAGGQAAGAALTASVGSALATQLVTGYVPYNLADTPVAPLTKASIAVSVAFVIFPEDPPTRQATWTQAPVVAQFPERFVVLGYNNGAQTLEAIGNLITSPLYVGPNPSADPTVDPTSAIHPAGADLFIPNELNWMMDFNAAVAAGMGIIIDLTAEQARLGFDRVLVLGVQMSTTSATGKTGLETLLHHHAVGRSGLTLVPQGTPTHNTSGTSSGYTVVDDADESFDDRMNSPLFTPSANTLDMRDGQWLGLLLGIDPTLFQTIHGAGGSDQLQARAMQRALWPATMGYWMDKLLTPVFDDTAVTNTRTFFTEYVSGRGPLPAIRIGRQPYGILPTTAFSRIKWLDPQPAGQLGSFGKYLSALYPVLQAVGRDWATMSANCSHLGGATDDAQQQLLDIVGLHPASVEFYSRYAESLSQLFNTINLGGRGPQFFQAISALVQSDVSAVLLASLGYKGGVPPDILSHYFMRDAQKITQVIDDRPLSETAPIRAYTDDQRNYIQWLIDAANTSLDAVREEQGFTNNASPQTLLYLYLRHALLLAHYDTCCNLNLTAGAMTAAQLAALKAEPPFVHVAENPAPSESRFALLYKAEPTITGSPSQLVTDYITQNLHTLPAAGSLADQLEALGRLAEAPTAQLERAFVEHIDLCSYRLDAWLLGLVNYQLREMRGTRDKSRDGIYLGAYSWLEDLRPSQVQLQAAQLPADINGNFAGGTPLLQDPTNGGYIHAPSMVHARTAAILRAGYLANATPANPDTMAVNLSSSRVRNALSLLEGIRNGQPLGALLGYQFERGLHDAYSLVEVDKFIYPLRKAFPLVADSLESTKTPANVPIQAIEASNVFDGRKMLAQINSSGIKTYPFGLTTLPAATANELTALNAQTGILLDACDAISDLALAEGVHQAGQGNFDRIAATLNAYTTGNFPPEPQIVKTPPDGIGLTHRVALHLQSGLTPGPTATPRAQAQPALDLWVGSMLPPFSQIGCGVDWADPAGNPVHLDVTCDNLLIGPLDLIGLLNPNQSKAMTEMDDRIIRYVMATSNPRPDANLRIAYMTAPAGKFSIFEVGALARSIAGLLRAARPLKASDVTLSQAATLDTDADVFIDLTRLSTPKATLDTLSGDMGAFLAALAPQLADPVANRTSLINGIDTAIDTLVGLLERCARFGLPASGWGFAYGWRHDAVTDLFALVTDLITRWQAKLANFDAMIAAYDALPAPTTDDVRFAALRAAELVISTQLAPLPATPALLRSLLTAKRTTFDTRRGQFASLLTSPGTQFSGFFNAVNALLPVSDFDVAAFDTTPLGDRAVNFSQSISVNITGHKADIDKCSGNVQAQLVAHDAAATAALQAAALQAGGKSLFGDDFVLIPEFRITPAQGAEWANALSASTGGMLLSYLTTTQQMDFPVQEWLCAAARVRPGLHAWETTVALCGALGGTEPQMTPIQFPYEPNAPWLAMQFPPAYQVNSDRLLYTACYTTPFNSAIRQCGLLLDDWSEIIPAATHTTGLTFNFKRPDNEAPQAILMVTPATNSGQWVWADLVGALNETLDLAKKRAVEPSQLDSTPYAPLLPATVMAATLYGITISTCLSAANGVMNNTEKTKHG